MCLELKNFGFWGVPLATYLVCLGVNFLVKPLGGHFGAWVACASVWVADVAWASLMIGSVACTSRAGRDSAFLSNNCWCFSASKRWDISCEWVLKSIFLYCCNNIDVAGGKVDKVFQSSRPLKLYAHTIAVGLWFYAIQNWKRQSLGNLGPLDLFSHLAWGKNKVSWWLNRAFSSLQSLAGSSTWMYCSLRAWSMYLLSNNRACDLYALYISPVGSSSSVLDKSSVANTVLASFIHSRKLEPSEWNALNCKGCNLDSIGADDDDAGVTIAVGCFGFLGLNLEAMLARSLCWQPKNLYESDSVLNGYNLCCIC